MAVTLFAHNIDIVYYSDNEIQLTVCCIKRMHVPKTDMEMNPDFKSSLVL